MSTVNLVAYQVIDMVASLMNDTAKTDYTYDVVLPYLNMAIAELNEHLEEGNVAITNQVSLPIPVKIGQGNIINLPWDLVEVQEVAERQFGSDDLFRPLPRKEFTINLPPSNSLLFWAWIDQSVRFNPNGALSVMEVQLKYIRRPFKPAQEIQTIIGTVNAASFLMYKTAALCSMFIGENETRSGVLNEQAELALERIEGISNKAKQQIMTRHRPFRAAFKMRGGY